MRIAPGRLLASVCRVVRPLSEHVVSDQLDRVVQASVFPRCCDSGPCQVRQVFTLPRLGGAAHYRQREAAGSLAPACPDHR
jgi:hypothetical protein